MGSYMIFKAVTQDAAVFFMDAFRVTAFMFTIDDWNQRMRDEYSDIKVSTKHVTLRIVLFVVVLLVAVIAFAIAITQIGHKDPGYHKITANPDEAAVRYASAIEFEHYFEGSSSQIKNGIKELQDVYSFALAHAYKSLDASHIYKGYVNPASLNNSICEAFWGAGSEFEETDSSFVFSGSIQVSRELFDILKDAYDRTLAEEGYSIFSGALHAYWNSIISLEDASQFDPDFNLEEKERLERLTSATADISNFRLIFDEADCRVNFGVSGEYLKLLNELEIPQTLILTDEEAEYDEEPEKRWFNIDYMPVNAGVYGYVILDLNLLHDAYELDWTRDVLEQRGFRSGYLTSDSGLMVTLSQNPLGEYCLYSLANGEPFISSTFPATDGMCVSNFCGFDIPGREGMHYQIADGTVRSEYVSATTGEPSRLLLNSYVFDKSGNIVECAYRNAVLASFAGKAELEAYMSAHGDLEYSVMYKE